MALLELLPLGTSPLKVWPYHQGVQTQKDVGVWPHCQGVQTQEDVGKDRGVQRGIKGRPWAWLTSEILPWYTPSTLSTLRACVSSRALAWTAKEHTKQTACQQLDS